TDATGTGSVEGTVGVWLEQVYDPWVLGASAWVGQRAPRADSHFGARFGGLVSIGRALTSDLFLAGYLTGYHQIAGSGPAGAAAPAPLRLVTAGLAFGYSVREEWRLQGSLSLDLPFSSFGMNEPAGRAAVVSLIRAWL